MIPHEGSHPDALAETRARRLTYPLGSGQAEELALAAGLKPVIRQLLAPGELDVARARFEKAGFVTTAAGKRYQREGDALRDTFDHRAEQALFVGRDAGRVAEAAACELGKDDETTRSLGRLLGYPSCCVDAFLEVAQPRANLALVAAAWSRTDGAPLPRLNGLDLAVFHLLPWAPCSFRCALSARYADAVASLVQRRFPAFLSAIERVLSAHRLMLDDDVQISLRGTPRGDHLHVDEAWPTAIDRHPAAPLSDAAARRVAALLTQARTTGTVPLTRGGAAGDGEARSVFVPFGA